MEAMCSGAIFGAFGGFAFGTIGQVYGSDWGLSRVALHGIAGGGLAEMSGGDFRDGAMLAGSLAVMAYGYNKFVDGRNPTGQTSSGDALHKPHEAPNFEEARDMMNKNQNSPACGLAAAGPDDALWENRFSEHRLRWFPNNIPFVNDGSFLHDFFRFNINMLHGPMAWGITMFPTIPFAVAWTLGGGAAYYAPYTSAIMSGLSN